MLLKSSMRFSLCPALLRDVIKVFLNYEWPSIYRAPLVDQFPPWKFHVLTISTPPVETLP